MQSAWSQVNKKTLPLTCNWLSQIVAIFYKYFNKRLQQRRGKLTTMKAAWKTCWFLWHRCGWWGEQKESHVSNIHMQMASTRHQNDWTNGSTYGGRRDFHIRWNTSRWNFQYLEAIAIQAIIIILFDRVLIFIFYHLNCISQKLYPGPLNFPFLCE